jgi:glycyl-tRNA synthetase
LPPLQLERMMIWEHTRPPRVPIRALADWREAFALKHRSIIVRSMFREGAEHDTRARVLLLTLTLLFPSRTLRARFMAEPKENVLMEKIVSLCKRRGFIYQSSEIYGGINGFWDYGPLGAELKRNVKELWWNEMTRLRDDVVGLDATIIMAPQIWKASGHVDTFADLMRECPVTKKRVRADQVEPQSGTVYWFKCAGEEAKIETWLKEFPPDERNERIRSLGSKLEHDALVGMLQRATGGGDVHEGFRPKPEPESRQERLLSEALESITQEGISVLLPSGKPLESAIAKAKEYFSSKGVSAPFLLERPEGKQVTDSQDFHPESGFRLGPERPFNLMLQTYVGPIQSDENIAYLRPETAQAIFAQFKNVLDSSRVKVPFGIAQVGKAFRNEVTPRNFTFRSREFEQMELEFFIKPDEVVEVISGSVNSETVEDHPGEPQPNWGWKLWHQYWVAERIRFYEGIGLSRATLGFHVQTAEELAHYARATVDILFKFPFGKLDEKGELKGEELEGIAARSDFDLSQHERFSGKPMGVFDEELRTAWAKLDDAKKAELSKRYYEARLKYLTKCGVEQAKAEKDAKEDADGLAKGQYIPHVIEPSAGADRLILALICNAFSETTSTDDKGKSETRVIMRFHPRVAPIKVGVFPLLKNKPELVTKARAIFESLRPHMSAFYDEAGAIGRRYARQDEAGTPFCVTVDFDTLGEKPELLDTVTLRYRDDGRQERLKISELPAWLLKRIR